MLNLRKLSLVLFAAIVPTTWAAQPESNPIRTRSASIAETGRLIIGFQPTGTTGRAQTMSVSQIQVATQQVSALAKRAGLTLAHSRQIAPDMHVMHLQYTLRGAEIDAALARLRADPTVKFAVVDQRRFPHAVPNDSLFVPTTTATGQWYMQTPVPTGDASAVDAISAWNITTGSKGIVIADVDSGIRFDHPDLGRVGSGGRLLPGFDFVGEDYNPNTSAPLGTFLAANDGDGWDPDPSDPGDWISASDLNTTLFANCGPAANSEWHGTRVTGILGAISNNNAGIAGMTWQAWMLPVRALGKCGGYDSDIIAAMQWAAGISVPGVPDNPYPANIINMSLGGASTTACNDAQNPSPYASVVTSIINRGVLIVASAGNASGPVETPGDCKGVLAVAGLRNIGTKVGYSSFGPEVGISAPAGNCINGSGLPCLRSIDTTFNLGATTPAASGYTDQTNSNLGTSFSAPIVSGIAALMRSVNANLTPPQLIARIQEGSLPFPTNPAVLTCPNIADPNSGECNCVAGQCGTGMANALGAVNAALRPIAAMALPTIAPGNNAVFDATGSAAACNHNIVSYAWTVTAGNPASIVSGAGASKATVTPPSSGSITLHLVVTDDQNRTDSADVTVTSNTAVSVAPTTAGSAACLSDISVMPASPTVSAAFSPTTISAGGTATLTITLNNSNPFVLTAATFANQLPVGVTVASNSNAATTCVNAMVSTTSTGISLAPLEATQVGVQIPAQSSCTIQASVTSATAGSYPNTIASGALTTGPAGNNTADATATLTVTAASTSSGGSHGGGFLDPIELLGYALMLAMRRRRPQSVE